MSVFWSKSFVLFSFTVLGVVFFLFLILKVLFLEVLLVFAILQIKLFVYFLWSFCSI